MQIAGDAYISTYIECIAILEEVFGPFDGLGTVEERSTRTGRVLEWFNLKPKVFYQYALRSAIAKGGSFKLWQYLVKNADFVLKSKNFNAATKSELLIVALAAKRQDIASNLNSLGAQFNLAKASEMGETDVVLKHLSTEIASDHAKTDELFFTAMSESLRAKKIVTADALLKKLNEMNPVSLPRVWRLWLAPWIGDDSHKLPTMAIDWLKKQSKNIPNKDATQSLQIQELIVKLFPCDKFHDAIDAGLITASGVLNGPKPFLQYEQTVNALLALSTQVPGQRPRVGGVQLRFAVFSPPLLDFLTTNCDAEKSEIKVDGCYTYSDGVKLCTLLRSASVRALSIMFSVLTNQILSCIGGLTTMNALLIETVRFAKGTNLWETITKCKLLHKLTISHAQGLFGSANGPGNVGPAVVVCSTSVTTLHINIPTLSDEELSILAIQFPRIKHLSIAGCARITNTGLNNVITSLKALKTIDIEGCHQITHAGIKSVTSPSSLKLVGCFVCQPNRDFDDCSLIASHHISKLSLRAVSGSVTDARIADVAKQFAVPAEYLDLSTCFKITDAAMSYIRSMKALTYVNVSQCVELSDIGLQTLSKCLLDLKELSVSGCKKLTDKGMSSLKGFPSLTELNLSLCDNITKWGISFLVELTELRVLDLEACRSVGDDGITILNNIPSLKCLNISRTNATDAGVASWKDTCFTASLESLNISGNSISVKGLKHIIFTHPWLTHINISSCERLGGHSHWFDETLRLPYLEELIARDIPLELLDTLDTFAITAPAIAGVSADTAETTEAVDLNPSNWDDSVGTDASLKHLGLKLRRATRLELSGCRPRPWNIENFVEGLCSAARGLRFLSFSQFSFRSISCLTPLDRLPFLMHLDLAGCTTDEDNLSMDACLKVIGAKLKNLRVLILYQCTQVTDAGVAHLVGLTFLEELNLAFCTKITSEAVKYIAMLPQLQQISLHDCRLLTQIDVGILKEKQIIVEF